MRKPGNPEKRKEGSQRAKGKDETSITSPTATTTATATPTSFSHLRLSSVYLFSVCLLPLVATTTVCKTPETGKAKERNTVRE